MNYSKKLRRTALAKRVVFMIVIAIVLGLVVGGVSGYALKTHIAAKDKEKGKIQTDGQGDITPFVYGAYDDRCFTEEISLNWDVGNLDFTPLDCEMPEEQQEFVFYLCKGYNIDFCLVMAMIQQESGFNANSISRTGDYGLMQINQMNHEQLTETLGVTDYLDPYQNIRAGVFTLRKLFERYQDTDMVLMAYNMGENAASCLWGKGMFKTDYTQSILTIQKQFNDQLEGD